MQLEGVEAAPARPLLRGVSHQVAAAAALVGWAALAAIASSGPARAAAHVYGACLFALFAVSATYHRTTWSRPARARMRRLDHAAIFLLIAGTYTPLCLLLGGRLGTALLAVVWTGAALGVARSVLWWRLPRVVVILLYVGLGWVVVPVLPSLRSVVGNGGVLLLATGGLAYTVGAVIFATRRPNPWPRVFGYHEIFHALVIVAAICHFAVAYTAVRAIH